MNRIRLLIISTIIWLFFLANTEAISTYTSITFLNIQLVTFIMAVGIFVVGLLFPTRNKLSKNIIIASLFGIYALSQLYVTRESMVIEIQVFNTIAEVVVIFVSYFLCNQLSNWFINYNYRLKEAVYSPIESLISSTFSDVEQIEKKISRARRFEHELSIVHVSLANAVKSKQQGLRFTGSTNKDMLGAPIAEIFQYITGTSTTKAWYNDNLLLCIPAGTNTPQVTSTIENIKAVMDNVLKIKVDIKTANFPQDGLVLSDLVENSDDHEIYRKTTATRPIIYNLPKLQSQNQSKSG
jgi:hypothetical protein